MKRKSAWLSVTACALTTASALAPLHAAPPEPTASDVPVLAPPRQDFSNLQVVPFLSGNIGFFDKGTGRLYVYDSHLGICRSVYKVGKLGERLELIKGVGVDLGSK